MVQTDEERKAKAKEYRDRPENKAKQKAKAKEYNSRPENIAKAKERLKTPEYRAVRRKRETRPENKAKDKAYRENKRLKVLQYYSKRLSNSDIPCCNCCGETQTEFLAVDHIAGRRQMDSEPELLKLGYSSKTHIGFPLVIWLTNNNFPDGFQILCHNCNQSKGYYGKCPHESERLGQTFDDRGKFGG
jgi:hypothetical protein